MKTIWNLGYEICLFGIAFIYGHYNCKGFYDNNYLYEKKSWLDWTKSKSSERN